LWSYIKLVGLFTLFYILKDITKYKSNSVLVAVVDIYKQYFLTVVLFIVLYVVILDYNDYICNKQLLGYVPFSLLSSSLL